MKVSKEELLHIANLADLKIKDDEIDSYLANLQDILNFAEVVNKAPIDNLQETIGANENSNVFRKDEVKTFETERGKENGRTSDHHLEHRRNEAAPTREQRSSGGARSSDPIQRR